MKIKYGLLDQNKESTQSSESGTYFLTHKLVSTCVVVLTL